MKIYDNYTPEGRIVEYRNTNHDYFGNCQVRRMTAEERKKYGLPFETKTCKRCGKEKLTEDFGKDKSKRDGLNIYCRNCCKEKKREIKK